VVGFVLFRATGFGAAASVLAGMTGMSGIGAAGGSAAAGTWGLILGAGLLAAVGPAAHQLVLERLRPQPWIAAAAATGFVYLLLAVGGGRNTEFIYFQF
jgi:hypothetical protein